MRHDQLRRQSLTAYGAPLCETIVDCPQPRGTEVLVRIDRCGVCHSDLHMQDGYFLLGEDKKLDVRAGRALPFTLGHEIAGVDRARRRGRRRRKARRRGCGLSLDRLRGHVRPAAAAMKTSAPRRAISASMSTAALRPTC